MGRPNSSPQRGSTQWIIMAQWIHASPQPTWATRPQPSGLWRKKGIGPKFLKKGRFIQYAKRDLDSWSGGPDVLTLRREVHAPSSAPSGSIPRRAKARSARTTSIGSAYNAEASYSWKNRPAEGTAESVVNGIRVTRRTAIPCSSAIHPRHLRRLLPRSHVIWALSLFAEKSLQVKLRERVAAKKSSRTFPFRLTTTCPSLSKSLPRSAVRARDSGAVPDRPQHLYPTIN